MRQLVLPPPAQPILDLALSPDGQTLAVAHRNYGVVLYDPFDARVKFVARGHFSRLRFREDGQRLLGVSPGVVVVSLAADAPRETHFHFNDFVCAAHFTPDEDFAALSFAALRTVRLPGEGETPGYNNLPAFVRQESLLNSVPRTHLLYPVGQGPENRVFGYETPSDARGNFVPAVVNPTTRLPVALVEAPPGFKPNMTSPRYHRENDWFALATARELAVYNWADLATLAPSPAREPRRRGLFQTVRETLLGPSAETRHEQRYGYLPTLRPRFRLPTDRPTTDPLPVAFLPDGNGFLCRGANSAIELRDLATGHVRQSWQFQRAWPRVLAVAPDGLTAMAAVKGASVTFWDLE